MGLEELIGRSPGIVAIREQIAALLAQEPKAGRLPPVLITGETGSGKGLLARILHHGSSRAKAQLVEVNGAAIPDHLLESELFGYERGAFTDARDAKAGLLQVAHRGTLFLDEVGLLPLSLQAKLLKVLEEQTVRRLGSTRPEAVDVWVISATNEDPAAAVRAGRLREDLYHRLAVIELALPPLRDRGDDIDLLVDAALARASAKYGGPPKRMSADAMARLRSYRWPGNVRELNSVVERSVLLCAEPTIPASALKLSTTTVTEDAPGALHRDVEDLERRRLAEVLATTGWNISRAAAALGITRNTVRARIARYGLRTGAHPVSASPHGEAERAPAPPVAPVRVRPSIAVLPLSTEGDDADSYFGDGIVEDIIGALASLRELMVISRTSTLAYRGRTVDVRSVGRELGVNYALTGTVRRAGNRMRASVELADTAPGTVIWASQFDGVSDDLFALQDQIATRVVATLAPQVREAELRRALRKHPDSLEAYDCMLRGLAQLYRLNPDDFADARTWLVKAMTLDPAYAAPYALLAAWHNLRVQQGWSPDPAADGAEVLRLASAALERDSFDATALALCGHARSLLRYEFKEAIAMFDRAIEASPSSYVAWTRSSPTYSYIGNAPEAIRRAEHGLSLSPLDPQAFFPYTSLGIAYYVAGEHAEGARWGRKAREQNARYTGNLRFLAANLAATGAIDEAYEVGRALVALEPAFEVQRFVDRYAIRDARRQEQLARDLRLAGLPG